MDEILDIVDEHDQVIGAKSRSEIYAEYGQYRFRVAHAFIRNSKGEIWIPRRTMTKSVWSGGLDFSVAGHIETGETYDEGFVREAHEECNLDMDALEWHSVLKQTPRDIHMPVFVQVYEILSDETPAYNPEDFSEYFWLTPYDALRFVQENSTKYPTKFPLALTIAQVYDVHF